MIYIKKLNNNIINKVIDNIKLEENGYFTKNNCLVNSMILIKHLTYIKTDEDNIKNNKIERAYSNLINNYA